MFYTDIPDTHTVYQATLEVQQDGHSHASCWMPTVSFTGVSSDIRYCYVLKFTSSERK